MSTDLSSSEQVIRQMKLCEERIGYEFRSQTLLQQSMTHSSCASSRLDCNERLEFLGDAILGMVICRYLYEQFPDRREGQLTQQKSSLVSRTTCARVARRLGAADLILVGRGLQAIPESIDAALVESLIAAIYLDGGIEAATAFILRSFDEELKICTSGEPENYKSILQEETQRRRSIGPTYVVVDQRGPDHAREYCSVVEFDGRQFESAWGRTKKEAEQKAAMNALQIINPELLVVDPD
ncbi:MAG: ribonuclease III [Fuerstiella sp.]|nr:ribonuclease III [Fuerstiella sp.]